jgi:PAS domain S-box-containing protein
VPEPAAPTPLFALILEDQEADFDLTVHELRRTGLIGRCQRVETEADFLAHLDQRPALILADYKLPDFSALKALRLMKERGLDIPFIVLTGAVSEEVVVECIKEGAADYLLKDRLTRLGPAVENAMAENILRSQKRCAEAELRKSNQRFQSLLETTKAIPWEYDLVAGRFTYVGPRVANLLGHPLSDWHAPGFWEQHVLPEDRTTLENLTAAPAASVGDCEFECRMVARGGAPVHLHCVVNAVSAAHGGRMLRGFMIDVTERRQMQDALARHAEDLARSNEELKQFAYAASHDLQEPLRMVAFYSQLLARRYKERLDSDGEEFLGFVLEGATRMSDLLKTLLAYSRVSTRKPDFAQVDTEAIFQESLEMLRLAIRESHATVTHTPLPTVTGDPTQIRQLFQNLLGNAIKFRGAREPEIQVSAEPEEDAWHYSVRDNGIGIEPQYFDTVFAIFQRLHTREEYEGSGVGLAICRRIMEQHGGEIWVESEPGAGSTFHFRIPKSQQLQC